MTITVNPNVTPTFTAVAPICSGAALAALPTTSNNGITGTWSPALNNTATTTYTFTPTAGLCATTTTMTITVNPIPAAPTALSVTICPNNSVTLTATAPGGTYEWFDAPVAGTLLSTGASYTTPVLVVTTTYYVQTTVNGCVSPRTAVTVTIAPALIVDAGLDATICLGDTYLLSVTPNGVGYSYVWDEPLNMGFSSIYNPTVNPTSTTTYTVTVTDPNNCVGSDNITITVNPTPTVTVPANASYCNGDVVPASTYVSVPAGGSFDWTNSDPTIGLVASGSGNTPVFTATNTSGATITATITVTPTLNGCIGTPSSYTITVYPTPAAPTAASVTICPNNSTTLTATAPGGTYEWFDAPVAGTLLTTGASYTTPVLVANTTYYVQTTINGCVSPRTAVTVTISPLLVVDAGLNDSICFGGSYTLGVTPNGVGYSYVWDEPANMGFSSIYNPTVNPTATTTYTVTVTDPSNCVGSDVVTIFADPQILLTMGVTNVSCNSFCDGQTTVVVNGGTAPYTYSWTSGGFSDTEINLCPNLYTVTVTDAIGCIATGDTTVTEPTAIVVNILSTIAPLCKGDCNGSITATSNGGTGVLTYGIDGINFQATGVFNNLCAGNYVITVQDSNLCQNTATTSLVDPALLVINSIILNDVSCNGGNDGSIIINASGGTGVLSYSINNGVTFSGSSNFTGLIAGSYNVIVKDANGCTVIYGVVDITEPAPISIPNVIIDVSCYGANNGQIVVAPQGGTPNYSYSWSVGGVGNSPVANNLGGGQVTVTVTDANGCTQDSTFTVVEPAQINFISFVGTPLNGCSPLSVLFTNTTDTSLTTNILWDLGNGNSPTNDTVSTVYTTPGSYTVSLTVTDNNGCSGTLFKIAYITVYDNPDANFTSLPEQVTLFDPTIDFIDQSQFNIVSWFWNFNDLGNSGIQNPSFTFPEDTGTYQVSLLVEDGNGCKDSIVKTVVVKGEYGIFVPNAFTPDGNGANDIFIPKGFGIIDKNYSFMIFDRWGEVIFESHDLEKGWDGTYKGKLVPNGVYVWSISFTDFNGIKHFNKIGSVSIVD